MTRTQGARNLTYDARRLALLDQLRERLARPDAPYPSYRELADACGVSQTTLRHYFGGRERLVGAVLEAWRERGGPVFAHLAVPSGPFPQSVRDLLAYSIGGHRMAELRQLHRVGFAEGLRSSKIGPGVVDTLLEPVLLATETRLRAHVERKEMKPVGLREAALILIAPVLVAFLHQDDLGGRSTHELDIEGLAAQHASHFITAYGA